MQHYFSIHNFILSDTVFAYNPRIMKINTMKIISHIDRGNFWTFSRSILDITDGYKFFLTGISI